MYLALIVLPLLGSIVSGLLGRKVGITGAQIITTNCIIFTTFFSLIAFIEVGLNNIPVSIHLFRWIDSELLNVSWGFNFDTLTVSMLIPVLIVSSLVHIYSIDYMSNDPHNQRFFSYLSLFTFMMIILVTANNYLLMFVGWEGVGVCSYLLVNFWYTRIAANQSSISAFLTNRVGDCFLTIGIFAILWLFGNIDYSTVFSLAPYLNENIITIIGICLLIGAMAKSSQVGLHVWLPMAMEGPTPVSALIHAATMVTAGVYLLMRTSPLIEYSSTVLIISLWIGAITTIFSSLIGLFQQDIKKIIAYSTMSQLGMMVIAVGISCYNIALFHLVNHAFYKGLLFLGAGSVIHAVLDDQDIRKYGGLLKFLPLTYSAMLIASLSLVAFPFMTGFYSKDFIIESAYGQFFFSSIVVYFIAIIGAIFTTLYSVKVLYLTFLTKPNGSAVVYYKNFYMDYTYKLRKSTMWIYILSPINNYIYGYTKKNKLAINFIIKDIEEGNIFMTLPLIILAVFSIFFGFVTKDIFIGLGSNFFADNSLFFHPLHEIFLDTEFALSSLFKLLPILFTMFISVISLVLSELFPSFIVYFKFSTFGYNLFSFLNQRFLIELLYNKYITILILNLASQTTKILDKGSVESIGPSGIEKGFIFLSKNLSSLDTGVITSYALYILIGLLVYILIPYLSLIDNCLLLFIVYALITTVNHVFIKKAIGYVTAEIGLKKIELFKILKRHYPLIIFLLIPSLSLIDKSLILFIVSALITTVKHGFINKAIDYVTAGIALKRIEFIIFTINHPWILFLFNTTVRIVFSLVNMICVYKGYNIPDNIFCLAMNESSSDYITSYNTGSNTSSIYPGTNHVFGMNSSNTGSNNSYNPNTSYNTGSNTGSNMGTSSNTGSNNSYNPNTSYNTGSNNSYNPNTSYNTGSNTGSNMGTSSNTGSNMGTSSNTGSNTGSNMGTSSQQPSSTTNNMEVKFKLTTMEEKVSLTSGVGQPPLYNPVNPEQNISAAKRLEGLGNYLPNVKTYMHTFEGLARGSPASLSDAGLNRDNKAIIEQIILAKQGSIPFRNLVGANRNNRRWWRVKITKSLLSMLKEEQDRLSR